MSDEHVPETPAAPEPSRPTQILASASEIDAELAAIDERATEDFAAETDAAAQEPTPAIDPAVAPEPVSVLDPAAATEPVPVLDAAAAPQPVIEPVPEPEPEHPLAVTVPAGSRVIAIVSRGPSPLRQAVPVGMPEVMGEEQGEALAALQEVGLSAHVIGDHSDDVPRGYVMGQYPAPGAAVQPGSDAVLLASRGASKLPAQRVVLPNVLGASQTWAVDILQSTSLEPRIHYDYHPAIAPGTVLAQLPSEDLRVRRIVRKNSSWTWIVSVALLVIIAVGAASVWFFNRPLPVPYVVGMSQSEAESTLRTAGFTIGSIATSQTLNAADIGKIIAQAPTPGTYSAHGSAIDVIISGGQALIPVPNVTGTAQQQAIQQVELAGLHTSVSQAYSSTIPSGSVVSQAPAAAQRVPPGTTVGLTVSMGTHTVTVPAVVSQTSAAAQSALKMAGFGVSIASNYDTSTAAGTVMTQLPTVGTPVQPGTIVGLTVSRGPAVAGSSVATAPPVVGKTQAKAKTAIANAHLRTIVVAWSGTAQPKGIVAAQLPETTVILTRKSWVIIFVSNGK